MPARTRVRSVGSSPRRRLAKVGRLGDHFVMGEVIRMGVKMCPRYRVSVVDPRTGESYQAQVKSTNDVTFVAEGLLRSFGAEYVGVLDRKTGLVSFYPASVEFPRPKHAEAHFG